MTRSELKARARQKLGGGLFQQNWLYAVLATLIFSALVSISSAAVIGPILLTGPLTYGLSYLYLKQSRTGNKMELPRYSKASKPISLGISFWGSCNRCLSHFGRCCLLSRAL